MSSAGAIDVLQFWFAELEPRQWWVKDEALDRGIEARFGELHRDAAAAKLYDWRETAVGRLAEIIVLDQFSRNIHRDTPNAFAFDGMALVLAQESVRIGADQEVDIPERNFFYMPYMHSESMAIHMQAVKLFDQPGLEFNLEFEIKHKMIIDRFGRYPHRNAILGRESTPEEIEFLTQPGSSF
ncbi:Uncharacterized conserved protein, DUF924 family [Mariprofundus ferrinatatus]|uniref:Uncharacterized conserved protein, DUF924 family n=1 Tax=Mariprofundus ferrinatatus TaxID=1921087 RepID=A0A2K8L6D0_9PROT|nr:DUF924 family protein [Mariprofundus ferrinatatus]ATX82793.1 Uncharacterized conserved protein, DUF924 family [Mariprofundus ferrinatatus]